MKRNRRYKVITLVALLPKDDEDQPQTLQLSH